jgi:N-acyl-D-aspartate/D-glutamate deacylase
MTDFDLVVRGGTVVDGTGAPARLADIGVADGVIIEVGVVTGRGAREVDADGAIVAPGFVDIHTHYDGQAVWDSQLQPSSWHGVTTVVAGNCGVGFAPARFAFQQQLIDLMEGVEDIPGTVLHEGLTWNWSSFGEYLDALEARPRDIDIATQVPHAALRMYAMGERAAAFQPATKDDVAAMAQLTIDALRAGALGFSTSRTINHKTLDGLLAPMYGSEEEELIAIAAAVGSTGRGVLQLITDFDDVAEDFSLMRSMVGVSRRPLSFSLVQNPHKPDLYREVLAELTRANRDGFAMRAQVASRPVAMLMGLECMTHPFMANPVWKSISHLPVAEQAALMQGAAMRESILAAQTSEKDPTVFSAFSKLIDRYEAMYELGATPNYEPDPANSIAKIALRTGRSPEGIAYDILVADLGRGLICLALYNYCYGSLDAVREMLAHEYTIPGLGDGGAHVTTICDSSFPSTLLQHWVRDRPSGRLDLEFAIQRQSRDTARAVGLDDRGELTPGFKADLNIIDMNQLRLYRPTMRYDLPAGGHRFVQRVDGYRHTFVNGTETYQNGEPTGKLPGRVIRGAQNPKRHLVNGV